MDSVANIFWDELVARLKAAPTFDVPAVDIKREHRTPVTRQKSPAIHVVEGLAKVVAVKRCDWRWEMDGTIMVFVRNDLGLAAADPIVNEVLRRIDPESTVFSPYSNGVLLEPFGLRPETEISDEDATAVGIELRVRFGTVRWTSDAPAG